MSGRLDRDEWPELTGGTMTRKLELPILSDRLVVRALSLNDFDRHFEIYSNPDVVRYLYYGPMDATVARSHLARRSTAELPFEGSFMNLGVEVRGEGVLIGEVALGVVSTVHRVCEVGYVFDPRWNGRGYATEATTVMVNLAFERLGAHRVIGRIDGRNVASRRVLERIGMRHEARFRENEFVKGEWTDEVIYAVLEDEWRSRREP
jgi:RimJ/RimL family protein N-acetyltransferase